MTNLIKQLLANDNVRRGLRTAVQSVLGFLAAGGLAKIWDSFMSAHTVNGTVVLVAGLLLTGIAGWAQNEIEDRTGKALAAPSDRKLGDQALGTGLGAKS